MILIWDSNFFTQCRYYVILQQIESICINCTFEICVCMVMV